MDDNEYLTVEELLSLPLFRHLKASTLTQWRHRKTGPRFLTIGRKTFYEKAEVNRWIEQQKLEANGPEIKCAPARELVPKHTTTTRRKHRLGGHKTKAERLHDLAALVNRSEYPK